MQKMFEPKSASNSNDPYLINPKGVKVQVPETRVANLLKNGFILFDPNWLPSSTVEEPVIERTEPLPLSELKKELSRSIDILEVVEI